MLIALRSEISAQTAAQIFGQVTDANGQAMDAATIQVIHVPSGTVYGAYSREDGRYNIPSMRVGGPYKIVVSYIGYKSKEENDIYLALGQNLKYNASLQAESVSLGEVVVTTDRNEILNSERTGAATNIKKEALNALPTLSRSLTDFVRLTPQSKSSSVASTAGTGTSFAGQDSRFNNLTVDGAIFNNSFGLASSNGGQTNSSPISLDAIEEVQVNLAPYDVRYGGFTGAGVNVVTKSGTNDLFATAFYNIRNENLVRDSLRVKGTDNFVAVPKAAFDVKQYGVSFGGPLVKDKLFYFFNYEGERRNDPATPFVAARQGLTGPNVTRVRSGQLDTLKNFLISNFNYDPGVYENYENETFSNKYLIKLDYNISKKHRASFKYNTLKSFRDVLSSNSGSPNGNRNGTTFALNFSNTNYVINNDIYSGIAELNSVFGSRMSNNISIGFTANRDYRSSRGGVFPLVDILDGTGQSGRTLVSFGYEPFTPNNRLNTDTWQFNDNLSFYRGRHTLTAGVGFEAFKFENTFTPTYYGQYVYNSLNDFYKAAAGDTSAVLRRYTLTYSALSGAALPTAVTKAYQPSVYLQDEWEATNRLKLTAGIRVDFPFFGNTALKNPRVDTLTFRDQNGANAKFSTDKLPGLKVMVSPRIGWNWDVLGNRSLQVRGGVGVFSGRPPFVWISNQIGNNGILTGQTSENVNSGSTLNKKYVFSPNVEKHIPTNATLPATYNLAITDPNFKFPQLLRGNLGIDKKLFYGFVGSLELIYSKNINNIDYYNANLTAPVDTLNGVDGGGDKRYIYGGTNAKLRKNASITDNIILTNTNKGYSYSATVKLEKQFNNGWYAMGAYNFSEAKDLITGGSIAFTSWQTNRSVYGNNLPDLAFSDQDQRHRYLAAVAYSFNTTRFLKHTVSVFYQAANQDRLSYTYAGDANQDGISGNDLMYVPKEAKEIQFEQYIDGKDTVTAARQSDAFFAFINNIKYLTDRKGSYAERNGFIRPIIHTFDFSYALGFTLNSCQKKPRELQVRFDIYNLGNLINSEWGVGNIATTTSPLQYAKYDAVTGNNVYRFSKVNGALPTQALRKSAFISDAWQAQIGLRYIFN